MDPRIAAYETLLLCEKEKQFSNIAVNNGIAKYRFEDRDRDFYTQLVYGVIEKQLTIDYLVRHHTGKSVKRLDKPVLLILRLSVYQILFLDRVPNSAAVSEGVKLASRFAARAKGLINAVLRKISDKGIEYPNKANLAEYYSVYYSVSQDVCQLLIEQYQEKAESILQAYNSVPHTCFQVNSLRVTPKEFIEKYKLDAITFAALPFAVKMQSKLSLSKLPFLDSGEAFVQDIASQLTTKALDPKPGMRILDVCACPGGKSFSAANYILSQDKDKAATIISCDVHESKLPLIEKGAKKLGFHFIKTLCHDGTKTLSEYENQIDRVICDVPCSGLGVIAKKPEIRYKDITEINALPELQYEILKAASRYLSDGGILVYSTCTVNKLENEAIIERFLKENTNFSLVDFTYTVEANDKFHTVSPAKGCLTLLPCEEHDGFFMAKIQKNNLV